MKPRAGWSVLPALGAIAVVYLAIPVVAFLVRLSRASNPGFGVSGLWSAATVSVVTATISLGVMCLFGIPLAYVLARSSGRFAKLVGLVVLVPLAIPPLMGGILLVYLVGPYSWVGRLFGGRLTESIAGVVLAQSFVAAPFLITVARAAFGDVDPALYDVAETLGVGRFGRFLRVAIPAARRGVRAGMVLAWLRAFGEYGATVILAYHPYSLPIFTYLQFGSTGLPNTEAPTAIALGIAAAAVALGELRFPLPRRQGAALPASTGPQIHAPATIEFHLDLTVGEFHLDLAYASKSGRIAILGPSGAGKSLTLRCLAGVLNPDRGSVTVRRDRGQPGPLEPTSVGYVPQSLGLFPHLRIRNQIVFGRGTDPSIAAYWVGRFGIDDLLDRVPEQLSGGERQRVSLARTFARNPDFLLLDEPFSALDAPVRSRLRLELRSFQRSSGVPSVVVTHDPEEAAMLADEILVISDGHLLQAGPTRTIFDHPSSPEVARLLGVENIIAAVITPTGAIESHGVALMPGGFSPSTGDVTIAIRAHAVYFSEDSSRGVVVDVVDRGSSFDTLVELAAGLQVWVRTDTAAHKPGEGIGIRLDPAATTIWNASSTVES